MEFVFDVLKVQPEGVIAITVKVHDPESEAQTEVLGELTMFENQWEVLKYMLLHGKRFYLDGEGIISLIEREHDGKNERMGG